MLKTAQIYDFKNIARILHIYVRFKVLPLTAWTVLAKYRFDIIISLICRSSTHSSTKYSCTCSLIDDLLDVNSSASSLVVSRVTNICIIYAQYSIRSYYIKILCTKISHSLTTIATKFIIRKKSHMQVIHWMNKLKWICVQRTLKNLYSNHRHCSEIKPSSNETFWMPLRIHPIRPCIKTHTYIYDSKRLTYRTGTHEGEQVITQNRFTR